MALVPIASEETFLGLLDSLNVKASKEEGGIYAVTPENLPVPIYLRFANGYAYVTSPSKTISLCSWSAWSNRASSWPNGSCAARLVSTAISCAKGTLPPMKCSGLSKQGACWARQSCLSTIRPAKGCCVSRPTRAG